MAQTPGENHPDRWKYDQAELLHSDLAAIRAELSDIADLLVAQAMIGGPANVEGAGLSHLIAIRDRRLPKP
jgi:hypothetical protein